MSKVEIVDVYSSEQKKIEGALQTAMYGLSNKERVEFLSVLAGLYLGMVDSETLNQVLPQARAIAKGETKPVQRAASIAGGMFGHKPGPAVDNVIGKIVKRVK